MSAERAALKSAVRIRLETYDSKGKTVVFVTALNGSTELATGQGDTIKEAVQRLVSVFREMQDATIDALNASGLVRWVKDDTDGADGGRS